MADDSAALDPAARGRAEGMARRCLSDADALLLQNKPRQALDRAECAVTWIKASLSDPPTTHQGEAVTDVTVTLTDEQVAHLEGQIAVEEQVEAYPHEKSTVAGKVQQIVDNVLAEQMRAPSDPSTDVDGGYG